MMKCSLVLLLVVSSFACTTTISALIVVPSSMGKSGTKSRGVWQLFAEEHKEAIKAALEATKKYGAQSQEARVLWEIAEEIEDSIFSPCSKR